MWKQDNQCWGAYKKYHTFYKLSAFEIKILPAHPLPPELELSLSFLLILRLDDEFYLS